MRTFNFPYITASAIIAIATLSGCTYSETNINPEDTGGISTSAPPTGNYYGYDTSVDTGDSGDTDTSTSWFSDLDGDGHGSATSKITGDKPEDSSVNWVNLGDDCDDSDPLAFPGAAEYEEGTFCMQDDDGDGYGAKTPDVSGVVLGTDCNDANASIHTGAADTAGDGVDQNCDGADTAASASYTYYRDSDGDGYGLSTSSTTSSSTTAPSGYVTNSTDCNDSSASIHPGATEIVNDGIDQDCSGSDSTSSSSTSHTICVTGVDSNVGTFEIFLMGNSFVDATYWPSGDWSSLSTSSTNQFVTISGTVQSCATWTNSALTRGATFKQNGYGVYSGANRWAVQAASSPVTISNLTFDGTALTPVISGNDEVYTVP